MLLFALFHILLLLAMNYLPPLYGLFKSEMSLTSNSISLHLGGTPDTLELIRVPFPKAKLFSHYT